MSKARTAAKLMRWIISSSKTCTVIVISPYEFVYKFEKNSEIGSQFCLVGRTYANHARQWCRLSLLYHISMALFAFFE